MHDRVDGEVEVPLGMAAEPRVVVEHAEEKRLLPLADWQQNIAAALVKIAVPSGMPVPHLEGAPLAGDEALFKLMTTLTPRLCEPVMSHEATHAGVAGQRQQLRFVESDGDEVVVNQLEGPGRMVPAQPADFSGHVGADARKCAGMFRHLALKGPDGVLLAPRCVEPPLDRLWTDPDHQRSCQMTPTLFGERLDLRPQLTRLGGRAQQRPDDRKAQPGPADAHRPRVVVNHDEHVHKHRREDARRWSGQTLRESLPLRCPAEKSAGCSSSVSSAAPTIALQL